MPTDKKILLNLDYWLTDEHTGVHNAPKTRIILSDTYMQGMNHIQRLKLSKSMVFPHYTVDKQGVLYQHAPPERISHLMDCVGYEHFIHIALENLNWLKYSFKDGQDVYTNTFGIHGRPRNTFEYEYRTYRFWDTYSTKQITGLKRLIKHVAQQQGLQPKVFNRPSVIENLMDFKTYEVIGRANLDSSFTDPAPKFYDYF